jgi:cytidyltransferase-like protein
MSEFEGMKAITFGVFDLLHYGHFELFRRIRELVGPSGEVIVLLQKDEWVTKYKDVKLVYNFEQRKQMLETLCTVTRVVPYDSVGIDAVMNLDFNLLVRGPEHNSERFQTLSKWCEDNDKKWTVLPRTEGISTTVLKQIIMDIYS